MSASIQTTSEWLASGLAGIVMLLPGPDNQERRTLREVSALLKDGDRDTAFDLADQAMQRLLGVEVHGPETFLLTGVLGILADAHP